MSRPEFYTPAATRKVLEEIAAERRRQDERYRDVNDKLLSGTGPDVRWLTGVRLNPATVIEAQLREDYEETDAAGELTWMHLVREEVAEAFMEDDPERLRAELIQVAALCAAWAERL